MKTIQTNNGTTIQLFNSAKEISAKRWNAFQTECIKCSTIGSTFEDAVGKLDSLNEHLRYNNSEAFGVENENLRLQLFSIYQGINLKANALIYLVKSINGKEVDPFDSETEELVKELEDSEISEHDVDNAVWEIRKK